MKIGENEMMEVHALNDREDFQRGTMLTHAKALPDTRATFAMELMDRIAIGLGEPDGEDAAGRQQLRLMEPEQVVKRACDIAGAAFKEFEARGWLVPSGGFEVVAGRGKEA